VDILGLLLADDRLKIESEDWLLKIIGDRILRDGSMVGLMDCIECKYLSVEAMSTFVSLISRESMSSSVWSSICSRLQLPVSVPNINPRRHRHSPDLDRDRPFDGIFAYLWRQCGENPHTAGLIEISVNDDFANRPYKCYDLLSEGKWWASGNASVDHYVQIDLKDLRLVPSGYSVKTHGSTWAKGGCFVRSWRFEGSNDDSKWKVLDSHTDSDKLMGHDKEVSFAISTARTFRFLRFIQTDRNSSGYRHLGLQRLELFGRLERNRE
jgi:hypothetical protein